MHEQNSERPAGVGEVLPVRQLGMWVGCNRIVWSFPFAMGMRKRRRGGWFQRFWLHCASSQL